jgi:predicted DNA binding CopG/RHH family protein
LLFFPALSLRELEKNLGEWKTDLERTKLVQARNQSMREAKDAKINMRVSQADLDAFKKIAADKGLGYQTLLGSVIRSYVSGRLVETRTPVQAVKTKKRA